MSVRKSTTALNKMKAMNSYITPSPAPKKYAPNSPEGIWITKQCGAKYLGYQEMLDSPKSTPKPAPKSTPKPAAKKYASTSSEDVLVIKHTETQIIYGSSAPKKSSSAKSKK